MFKKSKIMEQKALFAQVYSLLFQTFLVIQKEVSTFNNANVRLNYMSARIISHLNRFKIDDR